ncbi:hypothetical protein COC69_05905 [Bacillus cereus]|uniref:HTH cro/C1-type domain-containing protein n=1 Tax=Bacillus cereus TaxID=1396 RepID=A0A9X7CQT0_BACCE|nr:XRE family transcriptional regulator [Bacillus cereus]PGS81663.1 hypothetical protein COC69_05905 [Bacillus cereus]
MTENDILKITGSNIRKFRKEKKMSMEELAKQIGVAQSSVSSWETGKTFPRSSAFVKLSQIFHKDIDEIVGTTHHEVGKVKFVNTPIDPKSNEAVDIFTLIQSFTPISFEGEVLNDEQRSRLLHIINGFLSKSLDFEKARITDTYNHPKPELLKQNKTEGAPPYISEKSIVKLPTNIRPYDDEDGGTSNIPVLGEIAAGLPIEAQENILEYRKVSNAFMSTNSDYFWLIANGHSMEPRILDGDYVLIEVCPDVRDGEIGAVLFDDDNECTLKKVYHESFRLRLESINEAPEYADFYADINRPAKIMGRAVKVEADL